jgi:hypothetical protein
LNNTNKPGKPKTGYRVGKQNHTIMILRNLQLEPIDMAAFKKNLTNLDDVKEPTQEELEEELGDYYDKALHKDASSKNYLISYNSMAIQTTAELFRINGRGIFAAIRKGVCAIINALSTIDEIIEAVIKVVVSLIPGGIIVERVIQLVVKFFLKKGYDWLCPVHA